MSKQPTIVVESRVDVRTLATITKFLRSKNFYPQTRSDMIRKSLEHYKISILKSNPEMLFDTVEDAYKYLLALGLYKGGLQRGSKQMIELMQKEAMDLDEVDFTMEQAHTIASDVDIERFVKELEQNEGEES